MRLPPPSIAPESVRLVVAPVTWKAPVPLAAMVNFFVLAAAVVPVYCSVPVAPLPPSVTALLLLPSTPLVLASLIEPTANVPCCTLRAPLNVLAPERVQVPLPALVSAPAPLKMPE